MRHRVIKFALIASSFLILLAWLFESFPFHGVRDGELIGKNVQEVKNLLGVPDYDSRDQISDSDFYFGYFGGFGATRTVIFERGVVSKVTRSRK
jgi:hypothetical protein